MGHGPRSAEPRPSAPRANQSGIGLEGLFIHPVTASFWRVIAFFLVQGNQKENHHFDPFGGMSSKRSHCHAEGCSLLPFLYGGVSLRKLPHMAVGVWDVNYVLTGQSGLEFLDVLSFWTVVHLPGE